jgi:hypothetical protein
MVSFRRPAWRELSSFRIVRLTFQLFAARQGFLVFDPDLFGFATPRRRKGQGARSSQEVERCDRTHLDGSEDSRAVEPKVRLDGPGYSTAVRACHFAFHRLSSPSLNISDPFVFLCVFESEIESNSEQFFQVFGPQNEILSNFPRLRGLRDFVEWSFVHKLIQLIEWKIENWCRPDRTDFRLILSNFSKFSAHKTKFWAILPDWEVYTILFSDRSFTNSYNWLNGELRTAAGRTGQTSWLIGLRKIERTPERSRSYIPCSYECNPDLLGSKAD